MLKIKDFYNRNKLLIQKAVFILTFILVIYILINHLLSYIAPFVVGYIIALILEPAVGFFYRKLKIHRGVSGSLLIIIAILLIVILGVSIITRITGEAISFSENIPRLIEDINIKFQDLQSKINSVEIIPEDLRNSITNTAGNIILNIASSATSVLGSGVGQGGINLVKRLPSAILFLILIIISAFFFIKDKYLINKSINTIMPEWVKFNFRNIKSGLLNALFGYIRAQFIIMSMICTICILGLTLLDYPYALLLAFIIAIIDMLPIFGAGSVLWPWSAYNAIAGNYSFAVGLIIIYGVVFLVRQFMEPKVLSSQIGIHPLITLMSIYAGLKVFGIFGFMIGPFLAVSIKTIIKLNLNPDEPPSSGGASHKKTDIEPPPSEISGSVATESEKNI